LYSEGRISLIFYMIFIFLVWGCTLVTEEKTNLYGVIIGINNYQDEGVNDLSGSVPDAEGMYSALLENGWKQEEITLLTDENATKQKILDNIASIISQAEEDDFVLIYYSGHGTIVPDEDGDEEDWRDEAIVPYDYNGEISSLILDDELKQIFSQSRTSKGVVIFDSCNSGGFINRSVSNPSFRAKSIAFRSSDSSGSNGDLDLFNFPVLTASGQDELAYENLMYDQWHGVFTYFLLQGFENLAADRDNDGLITVREIFNYAENLSVQYTEMYAQTIQHPKLLYKLDFVDILITR